MELLDKPFIKNALLKDQYFELGSINSKLKVINVINYNVVDQIKDIFQSILVDQKYEPGHFELQNIFFNISSDILIKSIIEIISKKIETIVDTIFDGERININLGSYMQIWDSYNDFGYQIYELIKAYRPKLIEKCIRAGDIKGDVISIIQIYMFYKNIVEKMPQDFFFTACENCSDITKKNVEQLINYIGSIRIIGTMIAFMGIHQKNRQIRLEYNVISAMLSHVDDLLKNLNDSSISDQTRAKLTKKIYRVIIILSYHCCSNIDTTSLHYQKFLQCRVIDPKYKNLSMELHLLKKIKYNIPFGDYQRMCTIVKDIEYSHLFKKMLKKSSKQLIFSNPIIISKNSWNIFNLTNMEIICPIDMQRELDTVSEFFSKYTKKQYTIQWQLTLGSAKFMAELNSRKVYINCNMLQAIALFYLNDHSQTTASEFSKNTKIPIRLSGNIFQSLFEANLITYVDHAEEPIYVINTRNYTGDTNINIKDLFIQTFA